MRAVRRLDPAFFFSSLINGRKTAAPSRMERFHVAFFLLRVTERTRNTPERISDVFSGKGTAEPRGYPSSFRGIEILLIHYSSCNLSHRIITRSKDSRRMGFRIQRGVGKPSFSSPCTLHFGLLTFKNSSFGRTRISSRRDDRYHFVSRYTHAARSLSHS